MFEAKTRLDATYWLKTTTDRLEMRDAGDGTLHVSTPRETPLSRRETHVKLHVAGEHGYMTVELDADGLAQLADALDTTTAGETND